MTAIHADIQLNFQVTNSNPLRIRKISGDASVKKNEQDSLQGKRLKDKAEEVKIKNLEHASFHSIGGKISTYSSQQLTPKEKLREISNTTEQPVTAGHNSPQSDLEPVSQHEKPISTESEKPNQEKEHNRELIEQNRESIRRHRIQMQNVESQHSETPKPESNKQFIDRPEPKPVDNKNIQFEREIRSKEAANETIEISERAVEKNKDIAAEVTFTNIDRSHQNKIDSINAADTERVQKTEVRDKEIEQGAASKAIDKQQEINLKRVKRDLTVAFWQTRIRDDSAARSRQEDSHRNKSVVPDNGQTQTDIQAGGLIGVIGPAKLAAMAATSAPETVSSDGSSTPDPVEPNPASSEMTETS